MANTINKLIKICMSTGLTKDALADIALQELLVYMIQLQTVNGLDGSGVKDPSLLQHIVKFIRTHLSDRLTMNDLTNEACMSKTSFYRYFKRELGMSPNEFVLKERIKFAKSLLKDPAIQVNQVCFESGFDDCNYFIRAFKKIEGITPKQFQQCQVISSLKI
ncbi:Xylose operon regulatory protein [compost metagenome]